MLIFKINPKRANQYVFGTKWQEVYFLILFYILFCRSKNICKITSQ